jgi:hypothetical protein
MPCLVESEKCPVCGGRHDFYLGTADLQDGTKQYAFTCPKDNTGGTIMFGGFGKVVRVCPVGAVFVHEVPPGS